jgi:hypothetical protein
MKKLIDALLTMAAITVVFIGVAILIMPGLTPTSKSYFDNDSSSVTINCFTYSSSPSMISSSCVVKGTK